MTTSGDDSVGTTAGQLRDDVKKLSDGAEHYFMRLARVAKWNRRMIWGLVVSLLLDIALSIVIAVVAIKTSETNSLANQNQQSQLVNCEAGNQARAVSLQLWTYVLDAADKNNPTPQARQQIQKFRDYIGSAYAVRDCVAAGK